MIRFQIHERLPLGGFSNEYHPQVMRAKAKNQEKYQYVREIERREADKTHAIPDKVIQVFNHLIEKNLRGGYASFRQDDAITLIKHELGISRSEIFNQRLLDVEDIFREQGWIVEHDKPGYNESYPATFTFRSK